MSTPLMNQYNLIKKDHRDAILFFRLGDFYEMFYEDAEVASNVLGITLTSRDKSKNIPMAGVPYHSANSYISKLIEAGYKVAVCEQTNSSHGKIVKRQVTQVITPGTFSDPDFLDQKDNNYIACVTAGLNGSSISYVDLTTGECKTTEFGSDFELLLNRLYNMKPRELVLSVVKDEFVKGKIEEYAKANNVVVNINVVTDTSIVTSFFNVTSLLALGLENRRYSSVSLASLLDYLSKIQNCSSIKSLSYENSEHLVLDYSSRVNLNLVEGNSLFKVLDKTKSALGARFLKKSLLFPLVDKSQIVKRQKDIEHYISNPLIRSNISDELKNIKDFERAYNRVLRNQANIRDLNVIKRSLVSILSIYKIEALDIDIISTTKVCKLLLSAVLDSNATSIKEGNMIVPSFNKELEELIKLDTKSKELISELEARENNRVKKAKIGYNKVFGYYIEVSKANRVEVPSSYIRKQTLANAERYITYELKELEDKILSARDKIVDLEYKIFLELAHELSTHYELFKELAEKISYLDFIISLSNVALDNNYVKPVFEGSNISVKDSRHPIIENMVSQFISNDISIENENTIILTGPNMSGKSTFMKQLALIVILAQMGSFVPASEATLPIIDKVFTRVGASDNMSTGESTFMVEMNEVSNILRNATKNSLIILDEVGRGTSTYDGIAIARAVTEYIHHNIKAKTIFATHYHELNKLEEIDGIVNYRIEVEENRDSVVFLKKVVKGSADKSYGIEVARLAELPKEVISRSKELLEFYSKDRSSNEVKVEKKKDEDLEDTNSIVLEQIKALDLNKTSPFELYKVLEKIKEAL